MDLSAADQTTFLFVLNAHARVGPLSPMANALDHPTLRACCHRRAVQLEMRDYKPAEHGRNVPRFRYVRNLLNVIIGSFAQALNVNERVPSVDTIIRAQSQLQEPQEAVFPVVIPLPNADTRYRCFHCFSITAANQDMQCTECGGWFLSELRRLDNGGLQDIYFPPDDMPTWANRMRGPEGLVLPASAAFIAALVPFEFTDDNANDECPVCLEEYDLGVVGFLMPCGHLFHQDQRCLLGWLQIRNTCPTCRLELPTDDELFEVLRRSEAIIRDRAEHDLPVYPLN